MLLLLHFYGSAFQAFGGLWQVVVLNFVLVAAKKLFFLVLMQRFAAEMAAL